MNSAEKEAYLVYCDNPENADIARVNTSAPEEVVYNFISADLSKCFGCITKHVSLLLKDLDLWNDNRYTRDFKTCKNGKVKKYKPSIVNETYNRLEILIQSGEISGLSERKQEIYFQIYDHMKFFRTELPEKTNNELQSNRPLQSIQR